MQLEGIVSEAFWSSFCPTMPMREPEAIPQTQGGREHAQEQTPWSADCTTSLCCSDVAGIDNEFNWLQSNCSASSNNANGFVDTTTSFQDYCSLPMDLCATQEQFNEAFGVTPSPRLRPDEFVSQTNKRRSSTQTGGGQMAGPKKKARSSVSVSINSNKAQRKSCAANEEEVNEEDSNERSSSCCSSEIELNASETTPKGSKKGSSIGAQCLYARKRRERINERLRILQNLVPNGTKVDIGTMLEEAAHYVKFLHLQIKLLSSDELWMYAPIAYNAMNI